MCTCSVPSISRFSGWTCAFVFGVSQEVCCAFVFVVSQEVCCICLIVAPLMWFIMSYDVVACINRFWQYTEVGYHVEI